MFSFTTELRAKTRRALGAAALLFVSFCASAQITVYELDNLPSSLKPGEGALVMSLSFSQLFDGTESVSLQYRPIGEVTDSSGPANRSPLGRTTQVGGGLGLMRGNNMNLLTLQGRPATMLVFVGKPGDYEFFYARAWGLPDLSAVVSNFSIPFKLVAGQTRYVGNLHLHALGAGSKNMPSNVPYPQLPGSSFTRGSSAAALAGLNAGISFVVAMARLQLPLVLDHVWMDEFKRDMLALEALAPSWRAQITQDVVLREQDWDHLRRFEELQNSPAGDEKTELLLMMALRGYSLDLAGKLLLGPTDRQLAIELIKKLDGPELTPEVAALLLPYVGDQSIYARYVKEESQRLGYPADSSEVQARYLVKAGQAYEVNAAAMVRWARPKVALPEKQVQLWRDRGSLLRVGSSKDPQWWGFDNAAELARRIEAAPSPNQSAIALDDNGKLSLAIEETAQLAIDKALEQCQVSSSRCVLQVINSMPVTPSCADIGPTKASKQYFLANVDTPATLATLATNGVDEATAKRFVEVRPPRALVRDTDSGKHFVIFRHCRATTVAVNQCYASGAKSCEIIAVDDAINRSKATAPIAAPAAKMAPTSDAKLSASPL
jgi:hypothetical protein